MATHGAPFLPIWLRRKLRQLTEEIRGWIMPSLGNPSMPPSEVILTQPRVRHRQLVMNLCVRGAEREGFFVCSNSLLVLPKCGVC